MSSRLKLVGAQLIVILSPLMLTLPFFVENASSRHPTLIGPNLLEYRLASEAVTYGPMAHLSGPNYVNVATLPVP